MYKLNEEPPSRKSWDWDGVIEKYVYLYYIIPIILHSEKRETMERINRSVVAKASW